MSIVLSAAGRNVSTNKAAFDSVTLSYVAELQPATPANYTVTAVATQGSRKLGDDQQLLVCEDSDQELIDVRAKPDLMAATARASGGKDLTGDPKLLASVFGNAPPVTVNRRHTPLWDKAWWLAGILGLLTVEWVVRRLRGLA